jgi:hypothetical protein
MSLEEVNLKTGSIQDERSNNIARFLAGPQSFGVAIRTARIFDARQMSFDDVTVILPADGRLPYEPGKV